MRANMEHPEWLAHLANSDLTRRLRVMIADASPGYMSVVLSVLEFHDVVDLVGRVATFEDAVSLALKYQPDLVLIDLAMLRANRAIPAIIRASRDSIAIVGICNGETAPLVSTAILKTVDAFIHKERLREEFLNLLDAHWCSSEAFFSISSSRKAEQTTDRWRSGQFCQTTH